MLEAGIRSFGEWSAMMVERQKMTLANQFYSLRSVRDAECAFALMKRVVNY